MNTPRSAKGLDVVLTGTTSDSHTWNLVYMQLLMEEWGHRVTNLGACVEDRDLVAYCARQNPDVVVVSSVNGHGFNDGARVIPQLRDDPRLADTPVVIGGKLGTGQESAAEATEHLYDLGFTAVFGDGADLTDFEMFLLEQLAPVNAGKR